MYDLLFLSLIVLFQNHILRGFYLKERKKFVITEQTFPVSLILSMTHNFVDPLGFFFSEKLLYF